MKKNRIVALIEARMGSSRLPGKVMKQILGRPVLGLLIERIQRAEQIDDVVVATSVDVSNDSIDIFCNEHGINCFRGSEEDVLSRIQGALQAYNADIGVQIYGDCPLIDPGIIDSLILFYMAHKDTYRFVCNTLKTTYPPGTELEVYDASVVHEVAGLNISAEIREHGTLYIRQHPQEYNVYNIEAPGELHYPDMEIELDTQDDFEVIREVYETLYPNNKRFSIYDVIDLMKRKPALLEKNRHVHRRWKEFRNDA